MTLPSGTAFPSGGGHEGFMTAPEVLDLAAAAGIAPGVSVLDLCCGVAEPGRLITRELGCDYLGVDRDAASIEIARGRAGDLACRFEVRRIPPLPPGPFDVVLLLETMLAFRDKAALLDEVARALEPGGRFAFTMEEGAPLTQAEREAMPAADTVWLTPLGEMLALLRRSGLAVVRQEDHSASHRAVVDALIARGVPGDLPASHRLWSEWLASGRVRKLAFVSERAA